MPDSKAKCIIILSSKSSGSSALQRILTSFPQVKHVSSTRHFEFETLYWVKAASILGLPQTAMLDSEVPIPQESAKLDLIEFLSNNLDSYKPPPDEEALIFGGWELLCRRYGPIFVEKSPHHLHQWSALELIRQCVKRQLEIDFLFVGLVRNPMAMLYSSWDRMRTAPETNQFEWLTAYENLIRFRDVVGERLVIVRYEEMVNNLSCLRDLFAFMGVSGIPAMKESFHRRSIQKWRDDPFYGFQLSEEVATLARGFGYCEEDLTNERSMLWPVYRRLPSTLHRVIRRIRKAENSLKGAQR